MSKAQTIWEQLRWDLLALLILVLVVVGFSALQQPRFQSAESPRADGSKPPDRSEGDVLLVVPTAPPARAVDFETMDCTFTWYNALWHYFGTFAMTPADTITPQLLAGHATVVIPARVASEIGSQERDYLGDFADQGGQLIVETPRQEWESITGVATVGAISRADAITSVQGLGLDDGDPRRDALLSVPLSGRLLPADDRLPHPQGPSLFEVNDQPALVIEPRGRGHVYSLLFDFSCSLLAMHQGKPTRDLDFGAPDGDRWQPTDTRVFDEALLATTIPHAELLQRAVLDRLSQFRPMARLWPFPGRYSGASMAIHPAPTEPRAAFGYADRSRQKEGSSTLFTAPDRFTSHHAALADELGADIGLLWVLGIERPPVTQGVGVGAIEPWQRELTLPQQKLVVERLLLRQNGIRQVHTEGSLWQTDWDTTFRTIAGAGLRIDTSFGPTEASHYGFLFGTSMPFHPLDDRGRPLPVVEFPFVLNGANLTTDRLRALLAKSQSGFHQPLVINLATDAMRRSPSVGVLLGFRDFHDLSRDHNHWLTTIGDYTDFLSARRHSIVTSQWAASDRRLTVSVNLAGARLPSAPDGAIPSVAVPEHYQHAPIARIEVDDEDVDFDASARSGTGEERLIELPAGRHVVSVFYESPPPDADGDQ